jgi:hypothetical protein
MYAGTCLDFDGTDDYISIPDDSTLDITGDMTVSCWVALDSSENGNLCMLVNKRDASDYSSPFYLFFEDRSGQNKYGAFLGGGSPNYIAVGSNNNFDGVYGKWDHVCFTVSGTTVSMYVNGAFDASGTFTGSRQTNNVPLRLGGQYTNGSNNYMMAGQMADVRIYNAALSAADVKKIYDDSKVIIPSNVSQTNLKCWIPMSEGAGTTTYDGSGNGNNGTMTNMTSADWLKGQTGAPQLIQGYNRPMLLDGSTNYVSIADSASLSVGSTFTISYWFYPESVTTEAYHVSKNTYSGNQKSYAVLQASSGKTQFRISGDGSSHIECTGSTTMSNKTWHHIVHVFDGSAGTKLKGWVDGTAQTFNQQPNVTGPYDSTSILCLGTRDAGLVAPLKGIINEVIIYNSALSDANATALFATGPNGGPLPPDPLSMSTSGNIVGYWRNDNNVTLTDLSGNSNTGTAVGSPSALLFKEGYNGNKNVNTGRDSQGFPLKNKNNGAIGFNGSDDEVVIPHSSVFNLTNAITQEVWVKFDTFANSGGGNFPTVIAKGQQNYRWYFNTNGTFVSRYAGLSDLNSTTGAFSTGQWYHVVLTKNGAGFKLYINGVLNNEDSQSGAMTANTDNYVLGNWDEGGARAFQGSIASAKIYNRALSRAEILQNYNAQKSRFT